MNKAIFWDRDGVLNHVVAERSDGGQNVSPQSFEEFKLVCGVPEILEKIRTQGYLNIIVTNQPDIARSKLSWQELNRMHDFLKAQIPAIDAVYVCPHDNLDNCHCRKPKPGLLLDAAKDYRLELSKCYMVGDTQTDIDTAKEAGIKAVLLQTHYNQEAKGYNFAVGTLKGLLKIF